MGMRFVFVAFFLLTLALPFQADAQLFGPVISEACKCENSAPTFGCVLQTIQNLLNLVITIGVVIATFMIAYAGFLWVLSPTDPKNKEKGRGLLINSVIGLVLILSAWLLVDTFMKVFYDQEGTGWGPWNEIILEGETGSACFIPRSTTNSNSGDSGNGVSTTTPGGGTGTTTPGGGAEPEQINIRVGDTVSCDSQINGTVSSAPFPILPTSRIEITVSAGSSSRISVAVANTCTVVTAGGGGGTGVGSPSQNPRTLTHSCTGNTASGPNPDVQKNTLRCENCVDLSRDGYTCTDRICALTQSVAQKVERIDFDGPQVYITEAFPPSFCGHRNSCHYDGTCIDVDIGSSNSAYSGVNINNFINAAQSAGLNAIMEFDTANQLLCDQILRDYPALANSLDVVSGATGLHFSVYSHNPPRTSSQTSCR